MAGNLEDSALREAIEALMAKERRVAQLEAHQSQNGLLAARSNVENRGLAKLSSQGQAALAKAPHNAFNQPLGRAPSSGGFGLASDASALMQAIRQGSQNAAEPLRVAPDSTPATASLCRHIPWELPSSGVLQASGLPLAPLQLEILRNRSFGRTGLSLASSGLVEVDGAAAFAASAAGAGGAVRGIPEHLQDIPLLLSTAGASGPGSIDGVSSLTLLDLSHNSLGLLSAGAVVEMLKRCGSAHTAMLQGNHWGGSLGIAGLLRAGSLLPRLRHFGIAVSDKQTGAPASIAQLKRELGAKDAAAAAASSAAAAAAPAASSGGRGGGRGGSSSAAARGGRGGGKAGGKGAGGGAGGAGAGPADADPTIEGVGPEEAGTAWHLCAAMKNGALRLRSLSVSGSSLSRAAAAVLFASCAEAPLPASSTATTAGGSGSAAVADVTLAASASAASPSAARGAPAGRGGPAARPGAGRGGSAAAGGAGGAGGVAAPPAIPGSSSSSSLLAGPSQLDASDNSGSGGGSASGGPVVSLDLSRTLLGGLTMSDLAIALAPAPASGSEKASELASLVRNLVAEEEALGPQNWSSSLVGALTAGGGGAAAAGAAAASGRGGSSFGSGGGSSFASVLSSCLARLPGSLNSLRSLNLSQCGLSTAALRPLLEVVASGQVSCLQVLCLRGNHIDDEGAGLLAECITANAARLAGPAADAAAFFASPSSATTLSAAAKSSQQAAGLQAALSVSPLRVIDVRNNPLYLSEQGDGTNHDGCRMLLEAFASTPSLLTLTGPEPSAEGLNGWSKSLQSIIYQQQLASSASSASASPLHVIANRRVAAVFGPSSGIGLGHSFPIDLCAILQAADKAYQGEVQDTTTGSHNTSSALANVTGAAGSGNVGRLGLGALGEGRTTASASLDAPHGLAHALARITIDRVREILKGAADACFGGRGGIGSDGASSSSSALASSRGASSSATALLAPSTALAEAQALLQASQALTVVLGKAPIAPLAAAVISPPATAVASPSTAAVLTSRQLCSALLAALNGSIVLNGNVSSFASRMGLDGDPLILQQGLFLHPMNRLALSSPRPQFAVLGAPLTALPLAEATQTASTAPTRSSLVSRLQLEHQKVQLSLAGVAPSASSAPSKSSVRLEWSGGMQACVEVTASSSALTPGALVAMVSRYKLVWTVLVAADASASSGGAGFASVTACDGSTFSQHAGAKVVAVRSQHATASHDRSHARARGDLADSACFAVALSESGVDGFSKGWSKDAAETSLPEALAFIAGGYKPTSSGSPGEVGFGGRGGGDAADGGSSRRDHFGRVALDSLVQVADSGPSSSSRDWISAAGLHEPTLLAVEHVNNNTSSASASHAGGAAAGSSSAAGAAGSGGSITLRCLLSWPSAWQSVDITPILTSSSGSPSSATGSSGATKLVLVGQLVNGSPPEGMQEAPATASEKLLAQVLPPPPAIKIASAAVTMATAEVVAAGSAANAALRQLALLSYSKAPEEAAGAQDVTSFYMGSAENDILTSLQF